MGQFAIRGVRASASLKLLQVGISVFLLLLPIRGVRASASLKRAHVRRMRRVHLSTIRGVRASASLKQRRAFRAEPREARHPRRTRLGLIEAAGLRILVNLT